MRCNISKGAKGEGLVTVLFERASPDPARSPTIKVVFDVHYPEGHRAIQSAVLVHLSSTREDTGRAEILSDTEFKLTYKAAAEFIAEVEE